MLLPVGMVGNNAGYDTFLEERWSNQTTVVRMVALYYAHVNGQVNSTAVHMVDVSRCVF